MKLSAGVLRDLEHHALKTPRDFALDAAKKGWSVVPLVPNGKRPLSGRGWQKAATTDPAVINRWFDQNPDANWGIPTDGCLIVDLDVKNGQDGPANWAGLVADIDHAPAFRVDTPSGGQHLYWLASGFRNSASTLAPGIDTRGDGGLIVGPGSRIDGKTYRASFGQGLPQRDELPTVTEDLRSLLRSPKVTEGVSSDRVLTAPDIPVRTQGEPLGASGQLVAFAREIQQVTDAAEGGRNDTLNRAAYNLGQITNEEHLPLDAVRAALADAARRAGLDEAEIEPTIESGLADGRANARHVGTEDDHDRLVRREVTRLRILAHARKLHQQEQNANPDNPGRMVPGDEFTLDIPEGTPAVWGNGANVLWAEGEALMLVGPPGVGKTTIANQVVRARLGLGDGIVLGLPVAPAQSRVLYLAMDRPRQIARSLRRAFTEAERKTLAEKLVVWQGPPPADIAAHPETLLEMARQADADTVILDSLKDAALGLTDDEGGAGYNRARQLALSAGVELLEIHHMVKNGANGTKPNNLQSVYGSAWLTAGAGSVVLLWGEAGASEVELKHLKQPAEEIGPWQVTHDHVRAVSSVGDTSTTLDVLITAGDRGVTVASLAARWGDESKAGKVRARRELGALVRQELATTSEGEDAVTVWRASAKARGELF